MPGLLSKSKKMLGDGSHTVLLVATSGDTGKAALEGFKDGKGLSVIVFFPHGGVSEIQRLQMATTEGSNVHVLAVRGNFDDCQTGVKQIFADEALGRELAGRGVTLSSANSINWGRLCPQIVYYFHAYLRLLELGRIERGEPIHVCVPTGNFGNILAGFYAKAMGLPIDKLICASNRNRILADFFTTRIYDRNREFHRTMSPSMDILISSNLERFLFEVSGHDASRVRGWYAELSRTGRFAVDEAIGAAMGELIVPGWVDEPRVLETIRRTFERFRYVVDPHTAVALAVADALGLGLDPEETRGPRIGVDPRIELEDRHTVIDSTASAYKFSGDVLRGIAGEEVADEFESIARLQRISGVPIHRAVDGLRQKPVRHERVIDVDGMKGATLEIIERLTAG
jgi:threonine synthase